MPRLEQIVARAIVPPDEGGLPERANSENDSTFSAIAELIEDLQNRVMVLEGKINSRAKQRRIEHHRDPITRQIISSTIIEEGD